MQITVFLLKKAKLLGKLKYPQFLKFAQVKQKRLLKEPRSLDCDNKGCFKWS